MPMTALAPVAAACSSISSKASSRARSHSSEYSVMLPPKRVWMPAPMLATMFRERTVMPRTTPPSPPMHYPSKAKEVLTNRRPMGMRLAPLTRVGGLRLDDYPFAQPAYAGKLRFATWHHSHRLAEAAARGDVDFVPIRYFDTITVFAEGGAWAPDAVIVHCAPPDAAGDLSLGGSVSYSL